MGIFIFDGKDKLEMYADKNKRVIVTLKDLIKLCKDNTVLTLHKSQDVNEVKALIEKLNKWVDEREFFIKNPRSELYYPQLEKRRELEVTASGMLEHSKRLEALMLDFDEKFEKRMNELKLKSKGWLFWKRKD